MSYNGFDEIHGAVYLIQKKSYMTNFHLAFDLRYYPSYQGFEGTRGGASVFRPSTNESIRYCGGKAPSHIYFQQSDIVS